MHIKKKRRIRSYTHRQEISKMRILIALCFIAAVAAFPQKKYGNPDEWGPYYQGDIRLPLPVMRNGLLDEAYRWPNGQVAYAYANSFEDSKKPTVEKAMQSYSDLTGGCITFVPRTTESDYVVFYGNENEGCYSYVGKIGGAQTINYPQWCINQYGSVQHEMYHALGFFHEQSRPDRDAYVNIKWKNIEPGTQYNFYKYDDTYVGTFGVSYDYGSVMHYSAYAFSRNGRYTIVTTDPSAQNTIGQRVGLSDSDVEKLMNMYGCPQSKNH